VRHFLVHLIVKCITWTRFQSVLTVNLHVVKFGWNCQQFCRFLSIRYCHCCFVCYQNSVNRGGYREGVTGQGWLVIPFMREKKIILQRISHLRLHY